VYAGCASGTSRTLQQSAKRHGLTFTNECSINYGRHWVDEERTMSVQDDGTRDPESPGVDAATFAAAIEAAWAEGDAGWERLARDWATVPDGSATPAVDGASAVAGGEPAAPGDAPPAPPAAAPCWWEAPPWEGRIADEVFRAIVALYVVHFGTYTPDLPSREPGLLRAWLREHADDAPPRVAA
jgi:hypothetical protein